ncbi:MAG TPA: YbhN family protein, partial [Mycobacterium sp.]|nr:YbhN family protein [Mycobacterium sp.]
TGLAKWREMLSQLESVSLRRRDLAVAFSWSLVNRFADVACLVFAAYASGYHASIGGLTVACAAARAVGTIPLMPGGLLVVEAVLVPGLASSGMPLSGAISTMLIYRLISWLLLAAVGWVVFFFMFRTENQINLDDADIETVDAQSDTAAAEPPAAKLPENALQGPVPPPDSAAEPRSKTRPATT